MLTHIRTAAHARAQIPDVVFHGLLARVAALRDPGLRVDSGIAAPASLNYFALLVGESGVGKTTGAAVAEELLPVPSWVFDFEGTQGLGSGEGIAEAYMGWEEEPHVAGQGRAKRSRTKVRSRALYYVDEGESLLKQAERPGTTAGATLRSAWVGALIGARNGREETTRRAPAHSYSLGMVVGIQPNHAAQILADVETGTPQRFAWAAVVDPTMPDVQPAWPGELPWTPDVLRKFVTMTMPDPIKVGLYAEHLERKRTGHGGDLESHRPLMMVKLSGTLALLDSRDEIDAEDWRLAGIVWATSCAVRDAIAARVAAQRAREKAERDDDEVTLSTRKASAAAGVPRRLLRIARGIANRVHDDGGSTHGAASRKLRGPDRPFYRDALDVAVEQGWVIDSDSGMVPGPSRPGEAKP